MSEEDSKLKIPVFTKYHVLLRELDYIFMGIDDLHTLLKNEHNFYPLIDMLKTRS